MTGDFLSTKAESGTSRPVGGTEGGPAASVVERSSERYTVRPWRVLQAKKRSLSLGGGAAKPAEFLKQEDEVLTRRL